MSWPDCGQLGLRKTGLHQDRASLWTWNVDPDQRQRKKSQEIILSMMGNTVTKKIICLCVCVPVRCPLIILSWELKSCLYFSLDDWCTAQSDKSWTLQWEREKDNGSHLPHLSGHQQANWCKHLKLPSSIQGWPLLQFSTWTIKWSLVDRRS